MFFSSWALSIAPISILGLAVSVVLGVGVVELVKLTEGVWDGVWDALWGVLDIDGVFDGVIDIVGVFDGVFDWVVNGVPVEVEVILLVGDGDGGTDNLKATDVPV